MPPKKILLLSVSAGAGHMRAAEAIRAQAALHHPDLTVTHLDVMDSVPSGFRKVYTDYYLRLVNKYPEAWRQLYQITNDANPGSPFEKLRRAIERLSTRSLWKEIADFAPDAIICTHFLPAELLSRLIRKGKLDCPVWVQVTDFDLHRMWVQEHMSGYFAASEEVALRMRAQGIAADAIHVTGIPIMPAFAGEMSREACAKEFSLDPAKTTVMLMSGGAGIGKMDAVAQSLLELQSDFQLIVITGKNAEALAALQKMSARFPGRLLPMGFTDKIAQLMSCSDLVITKPGGLTTAECLAMGLPMIVNSPIPGQEERNADYLMEEGVAFKAVDGISLEYRVRRLLQESRTLALMREKARALGRPDAAARVLQTILSHSSTKIQSAEAA